MHASFWLAASPLFDPSYASDLVPIWRSADGTSALLKVDHTKPAPDIADSELIPKRLLELRDLIRRKRAAEAAAAEKAKAAANPS